MRGNERLTSSTGLVLLVLLVVETLTTIALRSLLPEHIFLGMLLLPPVVLKLGTTGWRFVRYYTRNPAYRRKGPPDLALRLIAPVVVVSTVVVFASGVILLFQDPRQRGQLLLIHKVSFIVWAVFTGLHVLGHLPGLGRSLVAARRSRPDGRGRAPGAAGRWIALTSALVAGLVLAVAMIPDFAPWTARGALRHHDHRSARATR